MAQFRKKPVVIEAHLWDGRNHRSMFDFLTESFDQPIDSVGRHFYIDHNQVSGGLIIRTSEGEMLANIGDYIIKEPFDKERKFYPCKADIFELTYEKVEEQE